jgi:hypothetical protein
VPTINEEHGELCFGVVNLNAMVFAAELGRGPFLVKLPNDFLHHLLILSVQSQRLTLFGASVARRQTHVLSILLLRFKLSEALFQFRDPFSQFGCISGLG